MKNSPISLFIKVYLYKFLLPNSSMKKINNSKIVFKTLKDKYTLDEVKDLSDEELYKYFVEAENSLQ